MSLNGSSATVVLDASSTSDADNDSLQFLWLTEADSTPFAHGPIVTSDFAVGTHNLELLVSDPIDSVTQSFRIDVVTLEDTVEGLINSVDSSDLIRQRKRTLIATLKAARASLGQLNYHAALGQLRAFENKVNAQVLGTAPELAEEWLRIVQQIRLLTSDALTSR